MIGLVRSIQMAPGCRPSPWQLHRCTRGCSLLLHSGLLLSLGDWPPLGFCRLLFNISLSAFLPTRLFPFSCLAHFVQPVGCALLTSTCFPQLACGMLCEPYRMQMG